MVTGHEEQIIAAVTAKLVPPFRVGDKVTVTWPTEDFKRCVVIKIENGWYFIQSLDSSRSGACAPGKLNLL